MRQFLQVAVVICALVLSGCAGTNFKWEDAKRIKPGMTEAAVIEILGEPYSRSLRGNQTLLIWSYADSFTGSKSVSYVLQDGRVIATPFDNSTDVKSFE